MNILTKTDRVAALAAALLAIPPACAWAQDAPPPPTRDTGLPAVEDPASIPPAEDYEAAARELELRGRRLEVELRRLKHTYFRNPRAEDLRRAGIARLRDYTDPATFPVMLEVFDRSGEDVRRAIVEHLALLNTPEALATVAWTAVFDKDERLREIAHQTLDDVLSGRDAPERVQSVLALGLKSGKDRTVASSAQLAAALGVADAIPAMIATQVAGRRSDTGGSGALAFIIVGQQQAFVSDLTPVVADNAVAFDPELSVVTNGTVVRVVDAVVVTYRVEVHDALVRLTSDMYGQDTSHLGWDVPAWQRWYENEFLPHLAKTKNQQQVDSQARAHAPGGG